MSIINKEVESLLATDIFRSLLNSNIVTVAQINAVTTLLFKAGIDFQLSFNRGTNSSAKQAQLKVYINPTTSINFVFAFEAGGGNFA
ncbi:hypothetical protein JOC37_002308 [Desulfohalotomaculum tongense]|uniref:hypothetical protein n=1 Tax=Desulforadius tongensis TaxID=1216062 RepID=UPI00195BCE79|nr:hypothetical protein [Desulforadius tongensis]MBM7855886.1 hypothetical protein [Desulforadius tongensis]